MKKLPELFERNRLWSERMKSQDAAMFERLSAVQRPKYLCVDESYRVAVEGS